MKDVAILNTGVANIASVFAAVNRAGAKPFLTTSPERALTSDYAILPGVGTFRAGMAKLQETGLAQAIKQRVEKGGPLLAVCLGLQLLFAQSEESPGVTGLGLLAGKIERFSSNLHIPQLGWNLVQPRKGCRLISEGYAYFANSYCLKTIPSDYNVALTEYGETFVSALEYQNIIACQFHPELSGAWGETLINKWLKI